MEEYQVILSCQQQTHFIVYLCVIVYSVQESSRELEAELETQIKQAEHQVRELRSTNHRLLIEHNSVKVIFQINLFL